MSVSKRLDSGMWQARYVGKDGKRHSKDFRLKADAERWKREEQRKVDRGSWTPPSGGLTRVDEIAEQWLQSLDGDVLKQQTIDGYNRLWTGLVAPQWATSRLAHVTPSDVRDWFTNMTGLRGTKLGLSRRRQALQVLSMILDRAVRGSYLAYNPARVDALGRMKVPGTKRKKTPKALTIDEVTRLAAASGEYSPFIWFLATTGLRFHEATALTVDDVDWLRRTVHVSKAYVEDSRGLRLDSPKSHRDRLLAVPAVTLDRVARSLPAGAPGEQHLFTSAKGSALLNGNFRNRVWLPALAESGLTARIHDLRHTASSLAIAAGATVKDVQNMMGHADASLTLNTYTHLFDDRRGLVADAMDLLLAQAESHTGATKGVSVISLATAR